MKKLLIATAIFFVPVILWANDDCIGQTCGWSGKTFDRQDKLVGIGMPELIARSLISNCKKTARDPIHCIKTGAFIMSAESSLGTRCYKFNCTGMHDGRFGYKNYDEGIKDWVKRYNKYWYKQKNPSGFYRADGTLPPTRYCMGPKNDGVCKHGANNAWKVFNQLNNF